MEENSKRYMKKLLLSSRMWNDAKDPITQKIAHSKRKEKILKSLIHAHISGPYQKGILKQQIRDTIKETTQIMLQERRKSMEDTLSKFMSESAKRHEENSNLIKEIRASTDAAIYFIILNMPEDIKVPLILGIPFLCIARAKIDVYKIKITLRVEEERIVFTRWRIQEDWYLMPTIEEGEVIEEFRTRDDELNIGIDDYHYDYDKKIHIDFLKDMDAYRDKRMGDVIFGEPFLGKLELKQKGPRERNIDEYWWRIYKSGDLEVLES
ncbi:hypothetical protein Tco_0758594 [Tanacetum coccineum]